MDYDSDMKKSVIDQMMGELDNVTADSLRKPKEPVKGVEIAITVSPKSDEDMPGEMCDDKDCEDPMHDHSSRDEKEPEGEGDYISQLLKKLG